MGLYFWGSFLKFAYDWRCKTLTFSEKKSYKRVGIGRHPVSETRIL